MRPRSTRWARYTSEERSHFIIEAPLYVRYTRVVLLYERRNRNGVIIEFVRCDVSAIFPFDSDIVDKDLFERVHVLERGKKGDVQIGLYVEVTVLPIGEGDTQNVII